MHVISYGTIGCYRSLSLYIYNYTRLYKYVVSHCIMPTTISLSYPFMYYMSNCSHLSTVQASAPSCNAQHLCSQKLRTSVGQSYIKHYQAILSIWLVIACPNMGVPNFGPLFPHGIWTIHRWGWSWYVGNYWHQCTTVFFARMSSGTSKLT